MATHRFIYKINLDKPHTRISDSKLAKQFRSVLRVKVGSKIQICDGEGNEAITEITKLTKKFVDIKILDRFKNENEPERYVTLYCSILKKSNFELVAQKATEVGVSEIVPLLCKRTIKKNVRSDRLEKIIKEAAEQSGRGILPNLQKVQSFEEIMNSSKENDVNLLFDQKGKPLFNELKDTASSLNHKVNIGIYIGPEGGWDDSEIKLARDNKFKIINLGKLTLRAETAAIVASYIMNHIYT
jgi:16S rRNA (uracil1498-N3)-methyltransferase